jgi:hypothetical protein
VVGLVVPQEQPEEEDGASNDIKIFFGDCSHPLRSRHEQVTCQFMAIEREALAAMLVVPANTAREATRVAAQEEAARGARGGGGNGGGGPRGGGSCGGADGGARGGGGRGRSGAGGDGHGPMPARSTSSPASAATASGRLVTMPPCLPDRR